MKYSLFSLLFFAIFLRGQMLVGQDQSSRPYKTYQDQFLWSLDDIKYHLAKQKIGIRKLEITRTFDAQKDVFVYQERILLANPFAYRKAELFLQEFYLTKEELYLKFRITSDFEQKAINEVPPENLEAWVVIQDYPQAYRIDDDQSVDILTGEEQSVYRKIGKKEVLFDHKMLKAAFTKKYPNIVLKEDCWMDFTLIAPNYSLASTNYTKKMENKMGVVIWRPDVTPVDRRLTFYPELLMDGPKGSIQIN